METPAEYKKTLFDRHGAAAADVVRAWGYGLMVFGVTMGAISFEMAGGGAKPTLWQWMEALGVSAVLGAVTGFAGLLIGRTVGKGWKHQWSTDRLRRTKNNTRTSSLSSCEAESMTR